MVLFALFSAGVPYTLLLGSSGGPRFDLQSLYVRPFEGFTISVQFKATRNGSPVGTTVTLPSLVGSQGFQKVQFTDFQDIDRVEITYTGGTFEKPWYQSCVVPFCQCGKQP